MVNVDNIKRNEIYQLLLEQPLTGQIEEAMIGLTWTYCQVNQEPGLSMSLGKSTRTLPWSGSLRGRNAKSVAEWITSWNSHEANIAMATINAAMNADNTLLAASEAINNDAPANLSVFEYFLPRITNKNVVVIGRYPGLERYSDKCNMTVIERMPGDLDLPDQAAEFLVPKADWVFLTASSIPNKTFPRLAELAIDTNLVLMGPTVPWLSELSEFGVDFLAGVSVTDKELLKQTVAEGGGTRIFETGVQYHVADLGKLEMNVYETAISDLVARRESLKKEMDQWYSNLNKGRYPRYQELQTIDQELTIFDSRFKRLWDARNSGYASMS
ncbi:MAG: DUF364 domain-containing protein [Gammaproteobacteria bacterium]